MVGDLTNEVELLDAGRIPGVGNREGLRKASAMVRELRARHPGVVVLPAHDPGAADGLARATGQTPAAIAK
jgi:glyoxylase-like metal-dependent hydrolase (beta-lactamase superfamily II)